MSILEVKNLKKEFKSGSGTMVLFENLSFQLEEKEKFLSILAPFGAGKSTLLKIIAGLVSASGGEVLLNGKNYLKPDTNIIYLPEKASSFPWLSVKENILLSSNKRTDRSQIESILKLIGLSDYPDHYPDSSSIGFRFRIALGRALILNPALILIDDSLRLIDPVTKSEIHYLLKNITETEGTRFLLATTDIPEAVVNADRVILLGKKPVMVRGEYLVDKERDKTKFLNFINDVFLKEKEESINFTV